jgi:hypothetical protein
MGTRDTKIAANKALDRMRGSAVSHLSRLSVTGAFPLIGQLDR